jgi:hypothetical protein
MGAPQRPSASGANTASGRCDSPTNPALPKACALVRGQLRLKRAARSLPA